jgi:hypothetical protein
VAQDLQNVGQESVRDSVCLVGSEYGQADDIQFSPNHDLKINGSAENLMTDPDIINKSDMQIEREREGTFTAFDPHKFIIDKKILEQE